MLTLFCVIVGMAGSAFSIDIDTSKSVDHLKKAIKVENSMTITCDARELTLFLAKKDGAWLANTDDDVKTLKKGEIPDGINQLMEEAMILDETAGVDDYFEPDIPTRRVIHVLVVVPAQNGPLTQQTNAELLDIFQTMLPSMLTHAPTVLTDRSRDFKDNLCKFYGCYHRKKKWVRCMLLNVAFPKSLVIASHLFRRNNETISFKMMQISDIDDERNGLLLFKPLEHAFDYSQISFIRDETNVFRLKLFDPRIRDTRLIDLKDPRGHPVFTMEQRQVLNDSVSGGNPCAFDDKTTFGDVDGSVLVFTGLERPFYRCLNLQARVARMIALKEKWIDPSYDFEDFWSDVSLDDKMEMFHQSILKVDFKY